MISYSKGDRSFESGLWWFSERFCDTYADKVSISLADRVEYTIIEFLRKHSELIIPELEKYLCNKFPGLFTPDLELIQKLTLRFGHRGYHATVVKASPPRSGIQI